jgi:hypothetical protein
MQYQIDYTLAFPLRAALNPRPLKSSEISPFSVHCQQSAAAGIDLAIYYWQQISVSRLEFRVCVYPIRGTRD